MRDLFYWFGFDLMGDFVMNKPFGMLVSQQWQYMVVRLQHALSLLGPASPAPWLIQLAFRLGPQIYQVRSWNLMAKWSWEEIHARLDAGYEKQPFPDLIHYLLEETNRAGDLESLYTMRGDTLQAIVAGRYAPAIKKSKRSSQMLTNCPIYIVSLYQSSCLGSSPS